MTSTVRWTAELATMLVLALSAPGARAQAPGAPVTLAFCRQSPLPKILRKQMRRVTYRETDRKPIRKIRVGGLS